MIFLPPQILFHSRFSGESSSSRALEGQKKSERRGRRKCMVKNDMRFFFFAEKGSRILTSKMI
jgi:hypothetical protein